VHSTVQYGVHVARLRASNIIWLVFSQTRLFIVYSVVVYFVSSEIKIKYEFSF